MVILNVKVDSEDKNLYMDGTLNHQLETVVKPSVKKKDFDWFVAIDGEEGSGKSVFAFQIAKVLDPNFTHKQIAFTANDFISLVLKAKKFSCVVFDEAFTGLSSRSSLSEINNLLVSLMMEMRQKNLFIVLVMPTFFMLDKYCVLHRAKGLFHLSLMDGRRGFWSYYNKRRMKSLYLLGKKFYDYKNTKPIIFGRFREQYMVNEKKYRDIKKNALSKKKRATRSEVYKDQRDTLFYIMMAELGLTQTKVTELCKDSGYIIGRSTISEIVKDKSDDLLLKLNRHNYSSLKDSENTD